MFWPFVELQGQLVYCPLADFGVNSVREGQDIYAQAVVTQPVTAHVPLKNAFELVGKIAVVQRGICDFMTKVLHVQMAGAVAVFVANNSGEDSGEAFVMDAGQRHDQLAATVTIPAMMVSRLHSADVFQQIREAYLDRKELTFTIRFLGAETASRVLAQQENLAQQSRNAARSVELKQQREHQQQEAATLLRNRLGKATQTKVFTPKSSLETLLAIRNTITSEKSLNWSLVSSSLKSNSVCSTRHSLTVEDCDTDRGDNQEEVESVPSATTLAMLHWCPMTTALVILDVQNYFTRRHGYEAKRTTDLMDTESDEDSDRKREPEPTRSRSARDHLSNANVAFYEHVDNVLIPTIQDVLLASRATEGMEVIYSVVESATRDGRDRSRAHKHAGIHVPKNGFGAKIAKQIAPEKDSDIVLSRTGVNVFAATNLDYLLRNLMVSHIVVMGISVLGSVESCVQTALDKGYQVSVLQEALLPMRGSTFEGLKTTSMLESFSRRGVQVLSSADFVDKLQAFT